MTLTLVERDEEAQLQDLLDQVGGAIASPAHLAWLTSRMTGAPWEMYDYLALLNRALLDAIDGKTPRLMVELPVRHGKSWLCSEYLPAWFVGTYPEKRVLLLSYADDYAAEWGGRARDVITEWGPRLFGVDVNPAKSASSRWDLLGHRGGMRAVGINGQITGRGGHVVVIDDPIKDDEVAYSPAAREKMWRWYQHTLRTRLEPDACIILVMSRWHEDDLAGKLLTQMAEEPDGDEWTRLRLPALAEEGDVLGRDVGEALCPQRYDEKALRQIRATLTTRGESMAWHALYQQEPTAPAGDMFQVDNFRMVEAIPHTVDHRVRFWDLAATEKKQGNDPDWMVGTRLATDGDGRWFVEDVVRFREAPGELEKRLRATAERDGEAVPQVLEQEGAASGKIASAYLLKVLAGFDADVVAPRIDKQLRARPWAAQVNVGNVYLLRGHWNASFIAEHRAFPRSGTHDDQVDSASGAFRRLTRGVETEDVENDSLKGSR